MSRIPQDIDDLMWTVAESGDAAAIEQFGERYPDFRAEMGKRLALVRQFRASRPNQEATPRFQRPVGSVRAPLRWTFAPAAAILLAALGFAAYQAASYSMRPKPQPIAVAPIETAPPVQSEPIKVESAQRDPNYRVLEPDRETPIQVTPEEVPWEKPIAMKLTGVRLRDALQAIAIQGGLTLELAPGMPDVFVEMEYAGQKPMAILEDMGRSFGFTALDQGQGRVLIVPEVDSAAAPEAPRSEAETGRATAIEPPPNGG